MRVQAKKKKMDMVGKSIEPLSLFSPCPDQGFFVLKPSQSLVPYTPPQVTKGAAARRTMIQKDRSFFLVG